MLVIKVVMLLVRVLRLFINKPPKLLGVTPFGFLIGDDMPLDDGCVTEYFDFSLSLGFLCLGVSFVIEEQPQPLVFLAHGRIPCENIEDNHVLCIILEPLYRK
jgi:hypothetical protein